MRGRRRTKSSLLTSRVRCRLEERRGATLGEMLVAVLILLLGTAVIAGGIGTALRVHRQMTVKENAQTLLGTTVASLNNDFQSARISDLSEAERKDMIRSNGSEATFYSNNRAARVTISNDPSKGILVTPAGSGKSGAQSAGRSVTEGQETENSGGVKSAVQNGLALLSRKAMPLKLHTEISGISLEQKPGTREAVFHYTVSVYEEGRDSAVESAKISVNNLS